MIEVNMNQRVRVKLTDRGREILRKNHDAVFRSMAIFHEYKLPREDSDGYTLFHLWELCREFGASMYNGCDVPFNVTIQLLPLD